MVGINYTAYNSKIAGVLGVYLRRKMFNKLAKIIDVNNLGSILDVGVTASQENLFDNFFEEWYPYKERITALSDQDARFLEIKYPGLKFVFGDGRKIDFEDNSFDLVVSSATIEHVGNENNQKKFIDELVRVSKKYIFITTPNRFFPIELHTYLPLLHWLPKKFYRKLLKLLNKDFFADENNLNLLSTGELNKLYPSGTIFSIRLFIFKSNLLLFIKK